MPPQLKIRKDDLVRVMTGRDRGKQGKVTQVFPRQRLVVVEGLNIRVKHLKQTKGRSRQSAGSRVQYAAPLLASKVMIVCPHCSRTTRPRMVEAADSRRLRTCHRCTQPLTA